MSGRIFNGRLEPKFNPFDDDYLAEILEAAAVAWNRMKHPTASEIEDRITYRLAGRLLNDPHFADLPYDGEPTQGSVRAARPRGTPRTTAPGRVEQCLRVP